MRRFSGLFSKFFRPTRRIRPARNGLRFEPLEGRSLLAGDSLPVLLVIADGQDFYYKEYNDTRQALEGAGLTVQVAATTTNPSTPHWNSGQGWESDGVVLPDLALADVDPDGYSAIAFIGGWGSSMYQYSFPGTYGNAHYNGNLATKQIANNLINEFLADDKFVAGICHGTTVLMWSELPDGSSPVSGKQISVPYIGSPSVFYGGNWYGDMELGQYEQAVANGAIANTASGQYGDPTTATDDVVVDGRIITAENWDSATYFGQVLAQQIIAAGIGDPPPANLPPVATDDIWVLDEHSPVGTVVGVVAAVDPDAGQTLTYAIDGGNTGNAFVINPATGQITVANSNAINFETIPVFQLTVVVSDDGDPSENATAQITIQLQDIVEPPPASVQRVGDDLIVQGSSGPDLVYLWSGQTADEVWVWMNGISYGGHSMPTGGRVIVWGGAGNDSIFATDTRRPVEIYGEAGHDLITGGKADDLLDGGDGVDRLSGGPGNDLIRGGAGDDVLAGEDGHDIILGGEGNDWIEGHGGRDLLLGGLGADTVRGGDGEDLLIGGTTSYDQHDAALRALRDAWLAEGSVSARAQRLAIGVGLGIYFASGETVHDDLERDTLWGANDADLLFGQLGDDLYPGWNDLLA